MGQEHGCGIESKAAIARHPIHPFLVVFPIASLVGALLTDLAWLGTNDLFWARASWWLLIVGLVTGLAAGLAGAVDYFSSAGIRRIGAAKVHAIGNVIALVLVAVNLGVRLENFTEIAGMGVILSAVTFGILGLTGWLGGELSFRHGVGRVAPDADRAPR
jgi:uncharacterized membrane protein